MSSLCSCSTTTINEPPIWSLLWYVDTYCVFAVAATYVNWLLIRNSPFETHPFVEGLATSLLTSSPLLVLVTAIISYRTHEDRQRAGLYTTALFIGANFHWIVLLYHKGIVLSRHHVVIWVSLALLFSFFIDLALELRWTPLTYATAWFWKPYIRENAERDSNHIWAIYARRYDPRKIDTVEHGTSQSFDAQHPLLDTGDLKDAFDEDGDPSESARLRDEMGALGSRRNLYESWTVGSLLRSNVVRDDHRLPVYGRARETTRSTLGWSEWGVLRS